MDENKIEVDGFDESAIYEGGSISKINADELKDNEVAIKQLINAYNLVVQENKNKIKEIQNVKAENEYLKTSPFISILVAIINVIGSVMIAIGAKLITEPNPWDYSWIIILSGGILIISGSLATILYPKARGWYNK